MSISPPPLKRRRVGADAATAAPSDVQTNNKLGVYSWNVNGIQPFIQRPITSFFQAKQPSKRQRTDTKTNNTPTASLRDFLRRHSWPTMLFLQEVKINPDDEATKIAVQRAVRSTSNSEPDYTAHFCLPSDPYNARGFGRKVYGVCTIVRQDFMRQHQARVRTVDWDREGRIQIVETKTEPKLSMWNIYAVNGTDNPYKDKTGAVVGTRHDRKLAVHKHILEEAKALEEQGYAVILAGDMNVARSNLDGYPNLRTFPEQHVRNRTDFNKKFFEDENGMNAVDTFRHVHGDKRGYTYYPRGRSFGSSCDRVDLIICSKALGEKIVDAGCLNTPTERGLSDHCPLFATFDIDLEQRLSSTSARGSSY